jgi:hypothetical protein
VCVYFRLDDNGPAGTIIARTTKVFKSSSEIHPHEAPNQLGDLAGKVMENVMENVMAYVKWRLEKIENGECNGEGNGEGNEEPLPRFMDFAYSCPGQGSMGGDAKGCVFGKLR